MKRIYSEAWNDYQLLDAGDNKKLERWGKVVTIRPDRNAYFQPVLSASDWKNQAHFEFIESSKSSGTWQILKNNTNKHWEINFNELTIHLKLTKFKHLGIFPEQRINWDYIAQHTAKGDRFLNLFAYTGVASLIARAQGAEVYHCDSVRQVINWSKENMLGSNLSDIHWILEDALRFAQREVKRGNKYKGLIMDPPAFGIGVKKERWKIENKFPELLELALQLKDKDGYIIANTYSPRLEAEKIQLIAKDLISNELVEVSNLSINSETGKRLDFGQRTLIS
ncbi:MAG: SAM-dependent methyltransferase [Gammaproteobacteria bacterium]|nr:MAG: SAM-dependent methyltransferase [Gammaproteobacteria bacterium]